MKYQLKTQNTGILVLKYSWSKFQLKTQNTRILSLEVVTQIFRTLIMQRKIYNYLSLQSFILIISSSKNIIRYLDVTF